MADVRIDLASSSVVTADGAGPQYSSIFDGGLTAVIDHTQVKVVSWYDDEFRYYGRLVDPDQRVLVPVAAAVGAGGVGAAG